MINFADCAPFARIPCANNPHTNSAQAIVQTPLTDDRPPVVEENFQWPPHGDPADDQHAFADQRPKSDLDPDKARDLHSEEDQDQEGKADGQTEQSAAQELMKITAQEVGSTCEVSTDRITDRPFLVWMAHRLFEMNQQCARRFRGKFLDAFHDVLFSAAIQVLFAERRRIH